MSKGIEWQELGKFLSIVLNVFSLAKERLIAKRIGPEIISWLINEGKESFAECFDHLAKRYVDSHPLYKFQGDKKMTINLSSDLLLEWLEMDEVGIKSWVAPELANFEVKNGLFLNERKIKYYKLPELGSRETIAYEEVLRLLAGVSFVSANVGIAMRSYLSREHENDVIYYLNPIILDKGGEESVFCWGTYDPNELSGRFASLHHLKNGFKAGSVFAYV
jgi:hypothetical protein